MPVRLSYNQSCSITPPNLGATSSGVEITFRANGPQDPLADIGGGQPLYWDQWTAIYNKYTVTSSKITLTLATGSEINPIWLCVRGVTLATGVTGLKGYQESNHNKCKVISAGQPGSISLKWYPSQFFIGKTPYDEELSSDVSTVPDRQCFFPTMLYSANNAGLVTPLVYQATVEYDVTFYDKIQPNQS